jgi:hypothetical protein
MGSRIVLHEYSWNEVRFVWMLVRQMAQRKNKVGLLLMEAGVSYNEQKPQPDDV